MTPAQLQNFLNKNGLSQRGAAKALDLNERSMRRYTAGDVPIPRVVEYALLWIAQVR